MSKGPRRDRVARERVTRIVMLRFHGGGSPGENFSSAAHR